VSCDGRTAQVEQIREDLLVITCGRSIDDNDRVRSTKSRR